MPPIEDIPGLEKGARNPADALVKVMWGLGKDEDLRSVLAETGNDVAQALAPRRYREEEEEEGGDGEW